VATNEAQATMPHTRSTGHRTRLARRMDKTMAWPMGTRAGS
jgi:hypothetical protein